jgi:hypothetical protein
MIDPNSTNPTMRSAAPRAPRASASPVAGVDKTGAKQRISRNRIETLVRDELRRNWVARVEELARLQVARLDAMIDELIGRAENGDLAAIDRALAIINSLDRLPGFIEAQSAESHSHEARVPLAQKLDDAAAVLAAEKPAE